MGFDPGSPSGGNQGNGSTNTQGSIYFPKPASDVHVNTSSMHGVDLASDQWSSDYTFNTTASGASALYASNQMDPDYVKFLNSFAHAIWPTKTGSSLWDDAVAQASALGDAGQRITPYQVIAGWAQGDMPLHTKAGGGGGGSGRIGPQAESESSIRRAMDQVSTALIGRTLDDKEFTNYYQSYKSAFSGDPRMDPTQHMTEKIRSEGDYQEYQVATKFANALAGTLKGAM